jgi:hypothetical protein
MPSDERDESVLAALGAPMNVFRSSLAATAEQVRTTLASRVSEQENGRESESAVELGVFADERINFERFSNLLTKKETLDDEAVKRIEQAHEILKELIGRDSDLFSVDVDADGCLRGTVSNHLKDVGRAFGASRVAELSKTSRFVEGEHATWLSFFPFALWNRAERRLAPPVIVHVSGADLKAETLADFLDGGLKVVVLVNGKATPAPLVRLITPNTFVMQTRDARTLDRLAAFDGPGIAAVVPDDDAARFIHDPSAGPDVLTIQHMPDIEKARSPVGGRSAAQQSEELRQLSAVATPREAAEAPAGEAAPASPVDKLAAWLLTNANLKDLD